MTNDEEEDEDALGRECLRGLERGVEGGEGCPLIAGSEVGKGKKIWGKKMGGERGGACVSLDVGGVRAVAGWAALWRFIE